MDLLQRDSRMETVAIGEQPEDDLVIQKLDLLVLSNQEYKVRLG
jgi:hypothetical protein